MAAANYRLCDKCGKKAFYAARLNYDTSYEDEDYVDALEVDIPAGYSLDSLGAWAVLCNDCAHDFKLAILPST